MVLCIAHNHNGLGLCSILQGTRRRLEMVSLCMQVVCWVVVVPEMWVEGNRFYNGGSEAGYLNLENMDESKNAYAEDVWEIFSFILFCGGNDDLETVIAPCRSE
jgi:hypothetical protein